MDDDTKQPSNIQSTHDDDNKDQSDTVTTEARDTLDVAVDSVADGEEGEVKSRDPEYYGDR